VKLKFWELPVHGGEPGTQGVNAVGAIGAWLCLQRSTSYSQPVGAHIVPEETPPCRKKGTVSQALLGMEQR
jgi:hypothetical protein